jgi:hypothetical protein|tara:strand:- start:347 stop:625 length:279 start_codon:yes stop_codon:yes gene_type:complete
MLDKTPLKSKKFIAYLIADFGWKIVILYMLTHLKSKLSPEELTFLLTIVITSGIIQIGYILGQAALDKYVNAAIEIFDRDKNEEKKELKDEK